MHLTIILNYTVEVALGVYQSSATGFWAGHRPTSWKSYSSSGRKSAWTGSCVVVIGGVLRNSLLRRRNRLPSIESNLRRAARSSVRCS